MEETKHPKPDWLAELEDTVVTYVGRTTAFGTSIEAESK